MLGFLEVPTIKKPVMVSELTIQSHKPACTEAALYSESATLQLGQSMFYVKKIVESRRLTLLASRLSKKYGTKYIKKE